MALRQDRATLLTEARRAVDALRDATRSGLRLDFRQRDPLVMAIHHALDHLEALPLEVEHLTECCGVSIAPIVRFCSKCGYEARVGAR
jgi:hypothetical protein